MRRRNSGGQHGFTLIELMVVLAIIAILATIAAVRYQSAVTRAREAVLHQDLTTMRKAIQQYTEDKEAAPSSLDDLVSADYLREVPIDPMTGQKDWTTTAATELWSPEQNAGGIGDVHSSSDKVSPFENDPYSSW